MEGRQFLFLLLHNKKRVSNPAHRVLAKIAPVRPITMLFILDNGRNQCYHGSWLCIKCNRLEKFNTGLDKPMFYLPSYMLHATRFAPLTSLLAAITLLPLPFPTPLSTVAPFSPAVRSISTLSPPLRVLELRLQTPHPYSLLLGSSYGGGGGDRVLFRSNKNLPVLHGQQELTEPSAVSQSLTLSNLQSPTKDLTQSFNLLNRISLQTSSQSVSYLSDYWAVYITNCLFLACYIQSVSSVSFQYFCRVTSCPLVQLLSSISAVLHTARQLRYFPVFLPCYIQSVRFVTFSISAALRPGRQFRYLPVFLPCYIQSISFQYFCRVTSCPLVPLVSSIYTVLRLVRQVRQFPVFLQCYSHAVRQFPVFLPCYSYAVRQFPVFLLCYIQSVRSVSFQYFCRVTNIQPVTFRYFSTVLHSVRQFRYFPVFLPRYIQSISFLHFCRVTHIQSVSSVRFLYFCCVTYSPLIPCISAVLHPTRQCR